MDKRYEYIGVVSPIDLLLHVDIKRASLIFDKIAIPNIASEASDLSKCTRRWKRDIDFLMDQGIIIDPVQDYIGIEAYRKETGADAYPQLLKEAEKIQGHFDKKLHHALTHPFEPASNSEIDKFLASILTGLNVGVAYMMGAVSVPITMVGVEVVTLAMRLDYDRRRLANDLLDRHQVTAFPLYVDEASFDKDYTGNNSDVLQISLRAVPEPIVEDVPWEKLLDFRNDPETVRKRMAFRNWINNTVRKDLKPTEIHDELEDLCLQYNRHIELHGLKSQTQQRKTWVRLASSIGIAVGAAVTASALIPGSVVAVATAAAVGGFSGDLITWLADKGTDAIFSVKERKIDLNLAEASAPGREVAYIAGIRNEFSQ